MENMNLQSNVAMMESIEFEEKVDIEILLLPSKPIKLTKNENHDIKQEPVEDGKHHSSFESNLDVGKKYQWKMEEKVLKLYEKLDKEKSVNATSDFSQIRSRTIRQFLATIVQNDSADHQMAKTMNSFVKMYENALDRKMNELTNIKQKLQTANVANHELLLKIEELGMNKNISPNHPSYERNRDFEPYKSICSQFDQGFYKEDYLKKHFGVLQEGKNLYQCIECDAVFKSRKRFKIHINRSQLKRPNQIVLGRKKSHPYPICSKTCGLKHNLNNHIQGVHEKNKLHYCFLCEYTCLERKNLENHINEVHEENKPFACKICNSKFGMKSRLNRHIKENHEEQSRQNCSLCSRTFSHIRRLYAHMASFHVDQLVVQSQLKYPVLQ